MRLGPGTVNFGCGEGLKIRGDPAFAEGFKNPVHHQRRVRVVEHRLGHAGNSDQVFAASRYFEKISRVDERRRGTRDAFAVGAVTTPAVQGVQILRRFRARRCRSHENQQHRNGAEKACDHRLPELVPLSSNAISLSRSCNTSVAVSWLARAVLNSIAVNGRKSWGRVTPFSVFKT